MNQRKMFSVPRNHNVVRRLDFGGEKDDQAATDNFANRMKEMEESDRQVMQEKYNFDFENEVALIGNWEWTKKTGGEWVLMEVKEDFVMKYVAMNDVERTPMQSKNAPIDLAPPTRRRKYPREDRGISDKNVKKRLTME